MGYAIRRDKESTQLAEEGFSLLERFLRDAPEFDSINISLSRVPLIVPEEQRDSHKILDINTGKPIFGYGYEIYCRLLYEQALDPVPLAHYPFAEMNLNFSSVKNFEAELRKEAGTLLARVIKGFPKIYVGFQFIDEERVPALEFVKEQHSNPENPLHYLTTARQIS